MKAFKIVRKHYPHYASMMWSPDRGGIVYIPRVWCFARDEMFDQGWGLCVFRTCKDALDLLEVVPSWLHLFWVEVGNPLLRLPKVGERGHPLQWPKGTLMVEGVKLLAEIELERVR